MSVNVSSALKLVKVSNLLLCFSNVIRNINIIIDFSCVSHLNI